MPRGDDHTQECRLHRSVGQFLEGVSIALVDFFKGCSEPLLSRFVSGRGYDQTLAVGGHRLRSMVWFPSMITIAEVLPKPIEAGNERPAREFVEFLTCGRRRPMGINGMIRYTYIHGAIVLQGRERLRERTPYA